MAYPKPDGERRNRNKRVYSWVDLPAEGRVGPAPKLPAWRQWSPKTREWWRMMWAKPQAVMWDQSGSTLVALAVLVDDLISGRADVARLSPEIRQHEDRHGLTPKAMLQLRWRIVEAQAAEVAVSSAVDDLAKARRARVLSQGDGGA